MRRFFHRHNGTNYRWDDIAYEANETAYERLLETVRSLINPASDRPWLIRGVSQSGLQKVKYRDDRYFILVGASESASIPKVRAFFTMTPELKEATQDIMSGTRLSVVLTNGEDAFGATGFNGDLNAASDLSVG